MNVADNDRGQQCDAYWMVTVLEGWTVRGRCLPCIRPADHDGDHQGQLGNGDRYNFQNSYGVGRPDRG